jgi:flagellar hook-basal body complex protein FliE
MNHALQIGQKISWFEMSEKKAIKIIKKVERTRKQKPAPKGTTTAQTAREMVKTVTNWVNELQQKRRTETANAIKLMLRDDPRGNEA